MTNPFDDLPVDPEAAFLVLEAEFQREYQEEIEKADNNSWADEARLKYAGKLKPHLKNLISILIFFCPTSVICALTTIGFRLSGAK